MSDFLFATFGRFGPESVRDIGVGAAAVITLIGARLCWSAPHHRMSIEERVKDGRITEAEARRRIQLIGWRGPVTAVLGCVLLAFVILK